MNGLSVLKRPAARCTDPLHIVNPPAARRTDPLHNVKRPAARCIEALDHRISGKIFRTDPPRNAAWFSPPRHQAHKEEGGLHALHGKNPRAQSRPLTPFAFTMKATKSMKRAAAKNPRAAMRPFMPSRLPQKTPVRPSCLCAFVRDKIPRAITQSATEHSAAGQNQSR